MVVYKTLRFKRKIQSECFYLSAGDARIAARVSIQGEDQSLVNARVYTMYSWSKLCKEACCACTQTGLDCAEKHKGRLIPGSLLGISSRKHRSALDFQAHDRRLECYVSRELTMVKNSHQMHTPDS